MYYKVYYRNNIKLTHISVDRYERNIMAITADKAIEAILKVWYKDGVLKIVEMPTTYDETKFWWLKGRK